MQALDKQWRKYLGRQDQFFYLAVDIHDTILESIHQPGIKCHKFYKDAVECLQYLSKRSDIYMILYTSTHIVDLDYYLELFEKNNIIFDDLNNNKMIISDELSDYSQKFYFNYLIDDKAGFNAVEDWCQIFKFFYSTTFKESISHHQFEIDLLLAHKEYGNLLIPEYLSWCFWYRSLCLSSSWCSTLFLVWKKFDILVKEDQIEPLDTYEAIRNHYDDLELEWTFTRNDYGYLNSDIKRFLFFRIDDGAATKDPQELFKINLKHYHHVIITEDDFLCNRIICILGLKL